MLLLSYIVISIEYQLVHQRRIGWQENHEVIMKTQIYIIECCLK